MDKNLTCKDCGNGKMDKNLTCKDCGNGFVFTSGEQEFYSGKGFPDPVRCGDCRKIKKDSKKNDKSNEQSI